MAKEYDYLLKVLLVGDSDVGKTEILSNLDEAHDEEGKKNKKQFFAKIFNFTSVSATYKTTIILLDGKRVKLQVSSDQIQGLISNTQFIEMQKRDRNSFIKTIFTDLGCKWPRSFLHNNKKLFERRSRNYSSV